MANNTDGSNCYCKFILNKELEGVGVRIWDLAILVPNVLFLILLCLLFQRARMKLYATNSPIFMCFYGLIWICTIFSVLRSIASMALSSTHLDAAVQDITNKVLWTIVRFLLLTAEISVLIFSLAFGRLESRHSIKAVLTTTGAITLLYSAVQGALELLLPSELGVFGHGGVIFLMVTSLLFTLLYTFVFLLPHTRISNVISIPVKPSFYYYALTLCLNCLVLTVGSVIVLSHLSWSQCGYCLINLAHYLYFSFFIPLVYLIFFNNFLYSPVKIPISYTMNESMYEDNVHSIDSTNTYLEDDTNIHQPSGSSASGGGNIHGGPGGSSYSDVGVLVCDNGHPNNFVLNGPMYGHKGLGRPHSAHQINYHPFLYNTNIQSPGTGYSSVEESTTATASAHGSMEFIQPKEPGNGEETDAT